MKKWKTLNVDNETYDKVKALSKKKKWTMNTLISELIKNYEKRRR